MSNNLPELNTLRLSLREVCLDDALELQTYQSGPDHWHLQAMDVEEYTDGQRVERYLQHRGEGSARRLCAFVARHTRTNQLIGEIGLSRTYPQTAALGFSVTSNEWGKGYATELVTCAVKFGFDELKVHRITAAVAVENQASCRVLEKVGMQREGTSRECVSARGRWWSEHQYAILESEAPL